MTAPLTDERLAEIKTRLASAKKSYDIDVWEETGSPYFQPPGWTWCKVVNDEHLDLVFDLPHCADEADARGQAQVWLDRVLARDPADADVLLAEVERLRGDLDRALERPTHPAFERLRRERSDLAQKLAAATRTVVRLAETRDRATTLLRRFVDDEPCRLDHHGLCQAHSLSGPPCRNAEARLLLGMDAQPGGVEVETGGAP